MADNVFEEMEEFFKKFPKETQEIFEKVTIETMDETFNKLYRNLHKSGSNSLNSHLAEKEPVYIKGKKYEREAEWDDETIVNEDKKIGWGAYADVPRGAKKRNYSLRPATYKDLAYIINYGRAENFSQNNIKIVAGNHFIDKAMRNAKNWRKKRDKKFEQEMDLFGDKL